MSSGAGVFQRQAARDRWLLDVHGDYLGSGEFIDCANDSVLHGWSWQGHRDGSGFEDTR